MITGFLLSIIANTVGWILALLPVQAFPTQLATAFTSLFQFVSAYSFIFPVGTLLSVLTIAMVYHIAIIVWNFAHLLASYIRGR